MSTEPNRPRKIRRTPEQIHEILKAYRASGQTRHRFAQEHGVGLSTLGKWLRKQSPRAKRARLVEVPHPIRSSGGMARLRLATGLVLELEHGCDVEAMARLAQLLHQP
jgi:transposase-like protein